MLNDGHALDQDRSLESAALLYLFVSTHDPYPKSLRFLGPCSVLTHDLYPKSLQLSGAML
jgi:hypothetical protein